MSPDPSMKEHRDDLRKWVSFSDANVDICGGSNFFEDVNRFCIDEQ